MRFKRFLCVRAYMCTYVRRKTIKLTLYINGNYESENVPYIRNFFKGGCSILYGFTNSSYFFPTYVFHEFLDFGENFLENTLYFFIGTFFYALSHFFWRIYKMFKFKVYISTIYFWLKFDFGEKFYLPPSYCTVFSILTEFFYKK